MTARDLKHPASPQDLADLCRFLSRMTDARFHFLKGLSRVLLADTEGSAQSSLVSCNIYSAVHSHLGAIHDVCRDTAGGAKYLFKNTSQAER